MAGPRARGSNGAVNHVTRWRPLIGATMLGAVCAAALTACSLVKLKRESAVFYASTVLVGRIDCPPDWKGNVIVMAYATADGLARVAHQATLHECGSYELMVPPGDYRLFAFGDANGNGAFDTGEPAGSYATPVPVVAPGTGVVAGLDFAIAANSAGSPWPVGSVFADPRSPRASTQIGALADLDAARFSAASGQLGYWTPVEFFRQNGGNVFFLEPYDPNKIPILFVHGAVGSPQDWRYVFDHIDRTRYQPWFFQYPSGASLDSMAYLLYWKLFNLQLRYRFDSLAIVAHSMGGLVVRDFLSNFGQQFPQIKLFVSLSTPWAGEASAETGVQHSPAVVPSWVDMQPGGRFVQSLFARPLPGHLTYYLFFGHKGGYSMLRPNNDGTVTLASQLRDAAQAEAKMVFGFDEDHVGILSSPQVMRQLTLVTDTLLQARANAPPPGQLVVNFDLDGPVGTPRPLPTLLLYPAPADAPAPSAPQASLVVALTAGDSGRRVAPIPPGTYDAALVASAFRTEPATQRVRVVAGADAALRFRLTPQGALSGYVGAEVGAGDNPAGSYQPPHAGVMIREITLVGEGGRRTLVPRRDGDDDLVWRYLHGRDGAYRAQFSFVGLPAGEYELSIVADGHSPYRSRHTVVPGRQPPLRPITLQPLR
jgi:hypothetical protein